MVEESGQLILQKLRGLVEALRLNPDAMLEDPEVAKAVFEAVSDAVVITGEEGTIRLVNTAAEHLFGYPRTAMIGHPVTMLMPEKYRAAAYRRYFDEPRERVFRGFEGLTKDGSVFPVTIALHPVVFADGGILVVATLREITSNGT